MDKGQRDPAGPPRSPFPRIDNEAAGRAGGGVDGEAPPPLALIFTEHIKALYGVVEELTQNITALHQRVRALEIQNEARAARENRR